MRIRSVSILLPFLLLAACADAPIAPDGPGAGSIDHGTAPGDLLVRVELVGGFVPVEWNLRNLPTFSLYGDGTLVVPGAQIAIYPGPALPAISRRTVDEAGLQAILHEVLDATADVPQHLGDMGSIGIADAATTVFTVRAGGVERRIEAYALADLGERPEGMPEDVYRARRRLADLVNRLGAPDGWVPQGSLGPEGAFEADAARILVTRYREVEDLEQEPIRWPLDVDTASFGTAGSPEGYRCGTVSGDGWDALRRAARRANELTPWTDGGRRFSIIVRPLLPDESGCPGDVPIP